MKRGVVHVWIARLDVEPPTVSSLLNVLNGEERVRAARLRTTRSRLRFIVAHGALRMVLGQYLDIRPDAIPFEKTAFGKPYVAGKSLTFNLSHSDELAVWAVTEDGQIGVDVERIRLLADADELAARYFAPTEALQYAMVPNADRPATFFSTWTRREAFVKMAGVQKQPFSGFEVEVAPATTLPRLIVHGRAEPDASSCCTLRSFTPDVGYTAAVALDGDIDAVEFFDWATQTALPPR